MHQDRRKELSRRAAANYFVVGDHAIQVGAAMFHARIEDFFWDGPEIYFKMVAGV